MVSHEDLVPILTAGLRRALGAVSFPTEEIKRRVSVDYVGAAGKAFASSAALSGQSMQVVLLSGALVVQDQSQTLYFLSDFRKLRVIARKNHSQFASY